MDKLTKINMRLKAKRAMLVTWWHTAALVASAAALAHFASQVNPFAETFGQNIAISDLIGLVVSGIATGFIALSDNQAKKAIVLAERIFSLEATLRKVKEQSLFSVEQLRILGAEVTKMQAGCVQLVNVYEAELKKNKLETLQLVTKLKEEQLDLLAAWRREIDRNEGKENSAV